MLKVRLHGEAAEIEAMRALLERLAKKGEVRILSKSDLYKDRGDTAYSRMYVDLVVAEEAKK